MNNSDTLSVGVLLVLCGVVLALFSGAAALQEACRCGRLPSRSVS